MSNNYQADLMVLTGQSGGGTTVPVLWEYVKNSFDALMTNVSGSAPPTYSQPYVTWVNTANNLQYYIEPSGNNSVLLNNFSTFNVVQQSSSLTLTERNHKQTILVDSSSGAITLTLSTLNTSTDSGYEVCIKKVDNSGNTVTVSYPDIDGGTEIILREDNDSVMLIYHGGAYYVRSSNLKPLHVPQTVTAAYTLVPEDHFKLLLIDNTANISINLPDSASLAAGYAVTLKKISGASLDITVLPNGSDTIEGQGSLVLNTQYQYYKIMTDQSGVWYVVSEG